MYIIYYVPAPNNNRNDDIIIQYTMRSMAICLSGIFN